MWNLFVCVVVFSKGIVFKSDHLSNDWGLQKINFEVLLGFVTLKFKEFITVALKGVVFYYVLKKHKY